MQIVERKKKRKSLKVEVASFDAPLFSKQPSPSVYGIFGLNHSVWTVIHNIIGILDNCFMIVLLWRQTVGRLIHFYEIQNSMIRY